MSTTTQSIVAGSIAGVVARTVVCPLDVLKIRLQVPEGKHFSLLSELKRLPIRSLWRGNTAGVMLYAAYNGCQFGIYSTLEKQGSVFLKAAGAALVATALTYPFDVLRTRMALSRNQLGFLSSIKLIIHKEGLLSFYKGGSLTLAQVVPYMGSVFAVHSRLKPFTNDFLAGAVSGLVCKTAFMPIDVLRKRMQLLKLSPESFSVPALSPAQNIWQLCQRMWAVEGGVRPFFRGWTMAVSKAAPTTGITFFVHNQLMKLMDNP